MSNPSETVSRPLLREWGLPAPGDSKKARGEVMVVGGSRSAPRGALLAGEAALRVGAGRIALAVPRSIDAHLGIAIPEAGIYALPDDASDPLEGRLRDHLISADAVLVGPGFDDAEETRATLLAVADTRPKLLVLDAFALGVLPDLDREALPAAVILNPNKEEAGILLGRDLRGGCRARSARDRPAIRRRRQLLWTRRPSGRPLVAARCGWPRSRHVRKRRCAGGCDHGLRLSGPRAREGRGLGRMGARDRR